MRALSGLLPGLLLLSACTAPSTSSSDHAIIGGTRSIGSTATVMLVGYPPDRSIVHTCTAVLVAPTVLLTSAHCIDEPTHPDYLYGVFTGDDASAYPLLVDLEPQLETVTGVYPHPEYNPTLPFYADIGVVLLGTALTVPPLPMHRTVIDQTIIGKQATIIGYGQTTYLQFNQARHEAVTTVTAIEDDTIIVGDTTKRSCLGDSGGPAIVDGVVVGIDSYGPTGCTGPAHYRRVDTFQPFISTFAPMMPAGPDAGVGPDAPPDGPSEDGGCTTTPTAGLAIGLVLLGLVGRRRRSISSERSELVSAHQAHQLARSARS